SRYEDIISRDDVATNNDSWVYIHRSGRGGDTFGNLPKRQLASGSFQLQYNPVDALLLKKAKAELTHSLSKAREKLSLGDNDKIDHTAAIAAVIPKEFIEQFHEYLKLGLKKNEHQEWSFQDILTFIACEGKMRIYGASAVELEDFGVDDEAIASYKRVRVPLSKADVPPFKRKDSKLPANSFDPILKEAIYACNKLWRKLFVVIGESWFDVDDDKVPHTSPLWTRYGMKRTPTKDKKLKPVFHVMAVIGTGYVCYVAPDLINVKLGVMLKTAIKHVLPEEQESIRSLHCFFLDRGYLEIAKAQHVDITNLIQIMETEKVKWLGTMKESNSFPFSVVDVKEATERSPRNRPTIQAYGTRSSFSARSGARTATVMRHGAGKVRAARAATNLVQCQTDTWAYETEGLLTRTLHGAAPNPLEDDPTLNDLVDYAWKLFHASVIAITITQRTYDWFLGRQWMFTSTTLHVAVNVKAAVYLNTSRLRELHSRVLKIIRLSPRKTIFAANADDLEDEDLPEQRGRSGPTEGNANRNPVFGDEKCSPSYWLRGGPTVLVLRGLCDTHGIEYSTTAPSTTKREMENRLAEKFRENMDDEQAHLLNTEVSDSDERANAIAQVAFLQRMTPQWFMRPFTAKTGGPIDQGVHNEGQVLRVFRRYLRTMSKGKYDIRGRVREYGLLTKVDHQYCASSPDGVFALLRRNQFGTYEFLSLCVLELKTIGSQNTADALVASILEGGEFVECTSNCDQFREAVPSNSYRSQLCQETTALGLEYVAIVYSVPGALVKIVLVSVSEQDRDDMLEFQKSLALKYMPFAHVEGAIREIPSLGNDYGKSYGYAQEHHTLEFYLELWMSHKKDVLANGTPPPCRRFIDLILSFWNKCMGNVDVVRKVLRQRYAKRGPDSGPGSLMWLELLGYIFYDAFRLEQHSQLEEKMDEFQTFKQFQKARRTFTFTKFLFNIANGNCFTEDQMMKYFPGLRELINHGRKGQPPPVAPAQSSQEEQPEVRKFHYKKIESFIQPGDPLYALRLDKNKPHKSVFMKRDSPQGRCIVCCE
ncbi:hypothetical protein ACHAWF_003920, partial [Thalassiosira exigua]